MTDLWLEALRGFFFGVGFGCAYALVALISNSLERDEDE